ncbi:MAG: transcription termination/antitermination protein NusG [Candidatus Daviesbacteria bacterium]|nr:transcription termination/antitermination protein NusG [Candidatus Daviesbacteria bacterium]
MNDDTQTQTEEVKAEETTTSSPVIASEAEGEVKQSSSDENLTQIASDSTSPRNDEEVEEPASAGDPSLIVQDDKKEVQDDKKNQNPNAKWYVVHTYSGHENKVAHTLKQRVESEHLEDKILEVLVPTQDKIEIKGGKKVNVKEKIFPGYILVKMVLDDVSWLAVRTTQGVTSFVGIGNKPTPISDAEVATIVKFTQTEAPMYKQVFMANDTVKIVDGPFADFIGKIDSVDEERGKVKVLVSIFGRETPVELDFLQIQQL